MNNKTPDMPVANSGTPFISVIFPVYNGEKYLREAIDSIFAQSYSDFELIIIDDGSKDGSLQILREYELRDSRVRLVTRENRGLPATLNEAIEIARGEFLARMDQDDISHPKRFEKQVALMEATGADICGCHWLVINSEGRTIEANITPLFRESFVACLSYTVPFAHGSVMMRKNFLVEKALKYDEIKFAEDYDLWIRIFGAGAMYANVDEFLFKYRDMPATLSKIKHKENVEDTKRLRRQFVKNNVEACLRAVPSLSENYADLPAIEQMYTLFLSYHVSLITRRAVFLQAFRRANFKLKMIGAFRILRG